MLYYILYFIFVHITLLLPGYVLLRKAKLLAKHPGIELIAAYTASIILFATLATIGYILKLPGSITFAVCWAVLLVSVYSFVRSTYIKELVKVRFPLLCLVLMSLLSLSFMSLPFTSKLSFIPDPNYQAANNYQTTNVKVLNLAQTVANDNYIPYRQAQFFVNHSHPTNDSFINEWGVGFFQRTPLMGAVTANYFTLLRDKPPIGYSWASDSNDVDRTYIKFQIIAQILNALFIIPAFYLLKKLFNKRTAIISSLFLTTSQFFLYNAFFSWPKSFVAFFILATWLLLYEKQPRFTYLASVMAALAYLTHDLAVIYLGATVLLLLYHRRIRDIFILSAGPALAIAAWGGISRFLYEKPSTFIYYPFLIENGPQSGSAVFSTFFNTSPLRILLDRVEAFYFLTTPYQLMHSEGGQELTRRLWAVGLFTIPGALGAGLLIPAILGAFKKLVDKGFLILTLLPVVICILLIGWPKVGALHFAEALVVLLSGLGVFYLTKLRRKLWMYIAFAAHCIQLVFFIIYCYDFRVGGWLHSAWDIIAFIVVIAIISLCSLLLYTAAKSKESALSL